METTRLIPLHVDLADPRQTIGKTELTIASRNSYPVVARQATGRDRLGLAVGAGGALLLGVLTFIGMSGGRQAPPARRVMPLMAPAAVPPSAAVIAPDTTPIHADPAVGMQAVPVEALATPQRGWAPVLVIDNGLPALEPARNAAATPATADAGTSGGASATPMANPAATIAQGTLIPAILETAIDSDLPGYARAVVTQDIKSFDGSHVLIPQSSRLVGEYKNNITAGQTRIYVLWSRLIRPDGVSISLASPAADQSGRSGLTGQVDGHFLKRFGSAILLSVVGAVGAVGSSGTSLVLSGGQSAASVAAQRDAQIAPTIRVRQGQPLRVFTARDLDFSTVASSRTGGDD